MTHAPQTARLDLVVVGAGIAGLACAWRASQRGLSVLVLERDREGAGASGVAAGMLAPVTEAEFGEEQLLRLNLDSAHLWDRFDEELIEASGGMPSHRGTSGALVVAADRDDVEELRSVHAFQRELGLEAEWLSGRECRRLEPGLSPRIPAGILAPHEAQVDPAATVVALAAAFERSGGVLRRGEAVAKLLHDGERVQGVRTEKARTVHADQVLLAAGCWSGQLAGVPEEALPPVRPVKGQILSLRSRGGDPPIERLVRTPRCYVVARADGRVVVGATVEERGFDTTVTADGVYRLLEAAWEVLPDVSELEFVEARVGLRPGTPDNAPLIGPGALDGLILATGHYRNGVLLAPLTAAAVAAYLSGDEPHPIVAPFTPARLAKVFA
jgi:glycine oxidase